MLMDLVGGPQGSGKSVFFPVTQRGVDGFNIDEHRKRLNHGQSTNFPPAVLGQAIADFESFINSHIDGRHSFAIEVTLAKEITFEQALRAQANDFIVQLTYVAAELPELLQRVEYRLRLGLHGVDPEIHAQTYATSMANLPRALRTFDIVQIFDNSRHATPLDADECEPKLVMETRRGEVTQRVGNPPSWLKAALADTEFRW